MKQNKKTNNNKKSKLKWITSNWFIAIVQLVASGAIAFGMYRLNSLPLKYTAVFAAVLVLGNLLYLYLLFHGKKGVRNLGKVLSVMISIAMFMGSFVALKTAGFYSDVTGGKIDTHMVSVLVLADDAAKELKDLQEAEFGYNENVDEAYITQTFEDIDKVLKKSTVKNSYTNNELLAEALLNKTQRAILISESQRSFIEEIYPEFDTQTKVIFQKGFEVEVNISTDKPPVNVTKDTYTFFISGIDTYGPVSSVSRSDVNMIMTVSPSTKQILLTSIPRDYHVNLATSGKKDKLTHAGNYGVEESVSTVENLFDINIDYYIKVNFSSLTKIVDALGGITVNSKFKFTSGAGQNIVVGNNNLNGAQALAFVRERKGIAGGDDSRILNQAAALEGIIKKAMSPTIIANYNSFLSSIGGSFVMSMPENDFKAIIRNQVDTMASWDIMNYAVTGVGATSTTTYSMPGRALYVKNPDMASVKQAHDYIQAMERSERISLN